MIRRLALVALVFVGSACGIRADTAARPLPDDEAQISSIGGQSAASATGAERIYLVEPGEPRLLRSVSRTANAQSDLIRILFEGPNEEELAAQYTSAIPAGTALLSASSQGQLLVLNVTDELRSLTGATLTQALAQIVYTATELDGIETIQINVEDERTLWSTPAGESKSVLRVYDFPTAVATGQPDYPALPGGV